MFRLSFLLIIFLLASRAAHPQIINEGNFSLYTKLQGLSHNYVSSIVQDSRGSIWIGTHKGLNRFDGQFFQRWFKQTEKCALPDNMINSLRITSDNELVGATLGGSFIINPTRLSCNKLIVPVDSSIYFWTNHCRDALKDNNGNYIVSTQTGLFVFDRNRQLINQYHYYNKEDVGKKELEFGSWVHTMKSGKTIQKNESGFSLYDPTKNEIVKIALNEKGFYQPFSRNSQNVKRYFVSKQDNIFVFNELSRAVDVFNSESKEMTRSQLPFNYTGTLTGVYHYSDTTLALTFSTGGFSLVTYSPFEHKFYGENKRYFADRFCTFLFKDREKRLWVGTRDGLYKENLSSAFFVSTDLTYASKRGIQADIRSILAKENSLFLGMDQNEGLLQLDKKTKKVLQQFSFEKEGKNCNNVLYLFDYSKDTIWMGTGQGLLWMNIRNLRSGKINVPSWLNWVNTSEPNCFLQDSYGNIWFSSKALNSIAYFNRGTRTFHSVSPKKNPLLRTTKCWSMAEDNDGNIWLAGDGLCRWNRAKQAVDKLIPYPTVTSGLRNYMLILGMDRDNNLWLSSFDNEIIQYSCREDRMYLRKKESDLIDGNTVTSSPLIDNSIWMGTDNGISVFNTKNYSIKQFTYADGLPTVVITTYGNRSFFDKADNNFYIGAGHHLISFKPDVTLSKRASPSLFIQSVMVTDSTVTDLSKNINLSPFQNDLSIRFTAINFNDPEDNRFAYCLINNEDSTWYETNTQNLIHLNNLSPGQFTLLVKLFSANNRWPDQTKRFAFTIQPPFWKTSWFFLLIFLVVAFTVYLIYRNHTRTIRYKASIDKQVAELELKALHAQMNPHFIFNSLNSIKDMILQDEKNNASRYLSRFAQLVRLNLEHSQQSFISLHQQVEYLKYYLNMEQLRFADFTYQIHTEENLNLRRLRIIPMLIQPLAENAIWHGLLPQKTTKEIQIRFSEKEDQLICEIEDNGIGINDSLKNKSKFASAHQSLSIKNIHSRLEVLNNKYKMNSSLAIKDKTELEGYKAPGTLVVLKLPLYGIDQVR